MSRKWVQVEPGFILFNHSSTGTHKTKNKNAFTQTRAQYRAVVIKSLWHQNCRPSEFNHLVSKVFTVLPAHTFILPPYKCACHWQPITFPNFFLYVLIAKPPYSSLLLLTVCPFILLAAKIQSVQFICLHKLLSNRIVITRCMLSLLQEHTPDHTCMYKMEISTKQGSWL